MMLTLVYYAVLVLKIHKRLHKLLMFLTIMLPKGKEYLRIEYIYLSCDHVRFHILTTPS